MCESVCETWEVREIIANLEVACGGMCRGYRQSDFWVLVAIVRVVRLCGRFREKRSRFAHLKRKRHDLFKRIRDIASDATEAQ